MEQGYQPLNLFFNQWEPPPSYAAAPSDPALVQRITKLADYAARNGPQFVKVMETKQKENPEFEFLFGGEGYAFYRYTLYCMLYQQPQNQGGSHPQGASQQPAQHQAPSYPSAAGIAGLPAEVEHGFQHVLEALTGSKDSIKTSQSWFMACASYASAMAFMMARRLLQLPEYEKQLHIIYLANDILFKSRQPGMDLVADSIAKAFLPVLGSMLAAAFTSGGKTEEVKARLEKILGFWKERSVFDDASISRLEHTMVHGDATTALAAAQAQLGATPAAPAQAAVPPTVAPLQSTAYIPGVTPAPAAPAPTAYIPGVSSAASGQGSRPPGPAATPAQVDPASYQARPPAVQHYPAPVPHYPGSQPPPPPIGGHAPWSTPTSAAGWHPGMPQYPGQVPLSMPPPAPAPTPWSAGGPPPPLSVPNYNYPPPGPQGAWAATSPMPRPPFPLTPGAPTPGGIPPHPPPSAAAPNIPGGMQPLPPPFPAAFDPLTPRPVSSFNFPPGLIPRLVKEKSEHSKPYEPLDPKEIELAGLPPPPEKDGYLRSRLESFHAEMAEYRPGMVRSDRRDDTEKSRDRDQRSNERERGSSGGRWGGARQSKGERSDDMSHDGSFAGLGSSSMYAGLGSNSNNEPEEEVDDDMYSQYRKNRSGAYHDSMAKSGVFLARPAR